MKLRNLLFALCLIGGTFYAMDDPDKQVQDAQLELLWQLALDPKAPQPHLALLKNVCILDLSSRALGQLPGEISSMLCLRKLDLSYNLLKDLPHSLGSLKKLKKLNLRGNLLTQLPACVTDCKKLSTLCLDNNGLATLPECISNLQRLRRLHVFW